MTGYLIIDAIVAYSLFGFAITWVALIPMSRRIGTLERTEQLRAKGLV